MQFMINLSNYTYADIASWLNGPCAILRCCFQQERIFLYIGILTCPICGSIWLPDFTDCKDRMHETGWTEP